MVDGWNDTWIDRLLGIWFIFYTDTSILFAVLFSKALRGILYRHLITIEVTELHSDSPLCMVTTGRWIDRRPFKFPLFFKSNATWPPHLCQYKMAPVILM